MNAPAGPVWFAWHGGASYSPPSWAEGLETAASVADVVDILESRFHNRDGRTPAVDASSGAVVFYADPAGSEDPYPDLTVDMVGGEYLASPA